MSLTITASRRGENSNDSREELPRDDGRPNDGQMFDFPRSPITEGDLVLPLELRRDPNLIVCIYNPRSSLSAIQAQNEILPAIKGRSFDRILLLHHESGGTAIARDGAAAWINSRLNQTDAQGLEIGSLLDLTSTYSEVHSRFLEWLKDVKELTDTPIEVRFLGETIEDQHLEELHRLAQASNEARCDLANTKMEEADSLALSEGWGHEVHGAMLLKQYDVVATWADMLRAQNRILYHQYESVYHATDPRTLKIVLLSAHNSNVFGLHTELSPEIFYAVLPNELKDKLPTPLCSTDSLTLEFDAIKLAARTGIESFTSRDARDILLYLGLTIHLRTFTESHWSDEADISLYRDPIVQQFLASKIISLCPEETRSTLFAQAFALNASEYFPDREIIHHLGAAIGMWTMEKLAQFDFQRESGAVFFERLLGKLRG